MGNNIVPQLDKSFFVSQIFWLTVSFAFLYFVCSRFIVPTIKSIIARRKSYKEEIENNTDKLRAEVDLLEEEYEKQIKSINLDADNLKKSLNKKFLGKIEAEQAIIDSKLKELKQETYDTVSQWENEMFEEEEKSNYSVTFASNILNKILNSKVQSKELTKYLDTKLDIK